MQNQTKASSPVNSNRNVNPKHRQGKPSTSKGSKYKAKQEQPLPQAPKRAARSHHYACTVCSETVFKKPVRAENKEKAVTYSGLGHWRCKCGNKAVKRVKLEAPAAETVAA